MKVSIRIAFAVPLAAACTVLRAATTEPEVPETTPDTTSADDIAWEDLNGGTTTVTKYDEKDVTHSYVNGVFNMNAGTSWQKGLTLNIGKGCTFNSNGMWSGPTGATKVRHVIRVFDGGTFNVAKEFCPLYTTLQVDEGGELIMSGDFKIGGTQAGSNQSYFDVSGSFSAPNGLVTKNSPVYFSLVQRPGSTVALGGPFSIGSASGKVCWSVKGGTIKATGGADVTVDCTVAKIAPDAAVTIDVDAGSSFDLSSFWLGDGASVAKTGAGTLKLGSEAPSSMTLDGGEILLPEAVTVASLSVGPTGGTLRLGAVDSAVNDVSGDLSKLAVAATDVAAWATDATILTSDTPAFLTAAADSMNAALPAGASAEVSGASLVLRRAVALKTAEWSGGGADANWSTEANWLTGAPNPGDGIAFDGAANLSPVNDVSGLSAPSVVFKGTAGAFTLGGSQSLTVAAITNFSASAQTIDMPLAAGAAGLEVCADGGDVVFKTAPTVAGTLVKRGGAALVYDGVARGSGKTVVEGGALKFKDCDATPLGEAAGDLVLKGVLDIGGKSLALNQSAATAPALDDGAVLTNGVFTYASAETTKDSLTHLPAMTEGTITIAKDATLTTESSLFAYQSGATGCGARRLLVDGGSYVGNSKNQLVIGPDKDWGHPAILELRNGATFAANCGEVHVGARWSSMSTSGAAGIVVANDSTITGTAQIRMLNESGETGSRAIIALTNSTWTTTRANTAVEINSASRTKSDCHMILNNSRLVSGPIAVNARVYAGSGALVTRVGEDAAKVTGLLTLDGGVLEPRYASAAYLANSGAKTQPSVQLLAGGGVIDAAHDVTVSAVAFGEGGWIKRGSGKLTLDAANLYTGATCVEAGVVELTGSLAGGIAVAGGEFRTSVGGDYASLAIDGGTATFNSAVNFGTLTVGENGGVLALGSGGCSFGKVEGAENLGKLTLSATPDSWDTTGGAVITSGSAEFLDWAAGEIQRLLSDTFTASVSDGKIVINADVPAKTTTWTGGGSDGAWATDANWDAGAPNAGDTVVMAGTARTATTLDSALSLPSLTFAQSAGAFTVGGDGVLTIGSEFANRSESAQTVNVPVNFTSQPFTLFAEGDVVFGSDVSALALVKTGAGTVTLSRPFSGTLDVAAGGVALTGGATLQSGEDAIRVGGILDLGGGTLELDQSESGDPILRDGAVLKNGTFEYKSAKNVQGSTSTNGKAFSFTEGTVTVGAGATLRHTEATAQIFEYAKTTPADSYGARRILVDGGALVVGGASKYVIGVDEDWDKPAVLELRNGATLTSTGGTEFHVGARNSGDGTSKAAKGVFALNDSTATLDQSLHLLNENASGGSCAIVALTNSTLTVKRDNGILVNQDDRTGSYAVMEVNNSTVECRKISANAAAATGKMAGAVTGRLVLDNGVVKARAAESSFIANGKNAAYPSVELLSGGGVIDTQTYAIAVPAVIYGEGGLTKRGAGTLTLSGENAYTGETVVEAGTLALTGSLAGGVTVKDGGTLSADGKTLPSLTIEKGGRIAVPSEYEGGYAELFRVTGEVVLGDVMVSGGKRLFVRGNGASRILCWGRAPGFQIILR